MRLVGSFPSEEQVLGFFVFLSLQGVTAHYEKIEMDYLLWVHQEEHIEAARRYYKEWEQNPLDPRFIV